MTLIVNIVEDGIVISGTVWATKNVDDCYTFAATPGDFGKFYQYNRNVAIAPTGVLPEYTSAEIVEWSEANDPCPDGWRLPTSTELETLMASGWRKVDPSADNWNVYGIWFGPDAATATSSNIGISIFLPAAGEKYGNGDPTTYFLKTVNYWSRSVWSYDNIYVMAMWNAAYWTADDISLTVSITQHLHNGHSVRCVRQ